MAYPIKFFSLQKAELEYEVAIRGGTIGESVIELRKQIVKLITLAPSEDILESHLEPVDDLKAAKESLIKSLNNITTLKSKFAKSLYDRTETLLNHLYHRLNRIDSSAEEAGELYKICTTNFKSQYKDLLLMKPQTVNTTQTLAAPELNNEQVNVSVSCERQSHAELSKLKFSGKTCVRSFIQKADEFMMSRSIPKEKMLQFAYEIFTDDALHWYRYIRDKVNTWDDVIIQLKQDFSQDDYDYRLLAEIRSRTQGEQENIIVYISIMRGMFSRLSKPLSEEEQLEILLHNIRPAYASTLASSPDITSIESLQNSCRRYESVQSRLKQFREPPKINADTLAPEFAYTKQSTNYTNFNNTNKQQYNYNKINYQKTYPNSNNYNSYHYTKKNTQENAFKPTSTLQVNEITNTPTDATKQMYCPRCRSNTHTLGSCNQPHFLICFKCGKKDVKYPQCPNCNETPKN
jgi:hypothetical protein